MNGKGEATYSYLGAVKKGQYITQRKTSSTSPGSADVTHQSMLVDETLNYLGVRYRFGGNTPENGFDCSGLVGYSAERALGLKLPRRSAEIARTSTTINKNELQPGDLVFFNTLGRRFSHVGIYLGDNRFVHAPSSGGVVRIEDMDTAYWAKRYNGARRLDTRALALAP